MSWIGIRMLRLLGWFGLDSVSGLSGLLRLRMSWLLLRVLIVLSRNFWFVVGFCVLGEDVCGECCWY